LWQIQQVQWWWTPDLREAAPRKGGRKGKGEREEEGGKREKGGREEGGKREGGRKEGEKVKRGGDAGSL